MYKITNPIDKAMGGMSQASGTYGRMMPNIPKPEDPGPTTGGTIMAGMGGATAGAAILGTEAGGAAAAALGMSNPVALGAMTALGVGAYLLS